MRQQKYSFDELSKDVDKLFNVLNKERPVIAVLLATSFLDTCLLTMLHNRLEVTNTTKFNGLNRALGSFSNRINICYCLDLIQEEHYKDLIKISTIRNKFAHSHTELDFKDEEIAKLCKELKFTISSILIFRGKEFIKGESALLNIENPKDRFHITTSLLVNKLLLHGLSKEKENLKS